MGVGGVFVWGIIWGVQGLEIRGGGGKTPEAQWMWAVCARVGQGRRGMKGCGRGKMVEEASCVGCVTVPTWCCPGMR